MLNRTTFQASLVIGMAAATGATLAAPSVVNGSFEAVQIDSPFYSSNPANIPGWTHGGAIGDALIWAIGFADNIGSVTTAGDARQFVTLGGGFGPTGSSDWSTLISGLVAGESYVLNFMTATELGTGVEPGGPQTMTVKFLAGSSAAPQSFTSPVSAGAYWRTWVSQTYSFIATANSATVHFSVTNQAYDMGLDNVTVSAVPEPGRLLLTGAGLALTLAATRRKRSVG